MTRAAFIGQREAFQARCPDGADDRKAPAFYQAVARRFNLNTSQEKLAIIVVAHIEHALPYFLEALSRMGDVVAVIPKSSSYVPEVVDAVADIYGGLLRRDINKEQLRAPGVVEEFLVGINRQYPQHKIMILDHGGYFAPGLESVCRFGDVVAGIVEHTLNGNVKYDAALTMCGPTFPIYSIAKSLLKTNEDDYVADALVTALKADIMSGRGVNQALERSNIVVLGYGHIGSAIAGALLQQGVPANSITICDLSTQALQQARLKFNNVVNDKISALRRADLVITATSARALSREDLEEHIPNNAMVVCATSRDDQFEFDALDNFTLQPQSSRQTISVYQHRSGKVVRLARDGASLNFSIGSISDPVIHAVLASICVSLQTCLRDSSPPTQTIKEISNVTQAEIEATFVGIFGPMKSKAESFGLHELPFHFVGRVQPLQALSQILQSHHLGVITQAVSGLGGVGKSTLAQKYAEIAVKQGLYRYIIQLNATDEEALYEDFLALSRQLGMIIDAKASPQETVNAIYRRLQAYRSVLIIFDNAAEDRILKRAWIGDEEVNFMPPLKMQEALLVHCIVTTRNSLFRSDQRIDLAGFNADEACAYIQYYLREEDEVNVRELAELLNYYPLALGQAVAYLLANKATVSIQQYIADYKQRQARQREFLRHHNIPESSYRETVYTTWNIAFVELQRRCPEAIILLQRMAYLAQVRTPKDCVQDDMSDAQFDRAIRFLCEYSLLRTLPASYDMHELVRTVVRLQLQEEGNTEPLVNCLARMHALVAVDEGVVERNDLVALLQHAAQVVEYHEQEPFLTNRDAKCKVKLLIAVSDQHHFTLFYGDKALAIRRRAEAICRREGLAELLTEIRIGAANVLSTIDPVEFAAELDRLWASSDLSVDAINRLAGKYIEVIDWQEARKLLTETFLQALPPTLFQAFGLQKDELLGLEQSDAGARLFFDRLLAVQALRAMIPLSMFFKSVGAFDIAISYCMFKADFAQAYQLALEYSQLPSHSASVIVEKNCLLVETRILTQQVELAADVRLLEQSVALMEQLEPTFFWRDQVFFLLSVLYACQGEEVKSLRTLFRIFDSMHQNLRAHEFEQSMRSRLHALEVIVDHFVEKIASSARSVVVSNLVTQFYRLLAKVYVLIEQFALAMRCYAKATLQVADHPYLRYEHAVCLMLQGVSSYQEAETIFRRLSTTSLDLVYPCFPQEGKIFKDFTFMRTLMAKKLSSKPVPIAFLSSAWLVVIASQQANATFWDQRLQQLRQMLPVVRNALAEKFWHVLKEDTQIGTVEDVLDAILEEAYEDLFGDKKQDADSEEALLEAAFDECFPDTASVARVTGTLFAVRGQSTSEVRTDLPRPPTPD